MDFFFAKQVLAFNGRSSRKLADWSKLCAVL